MTPAKIKEVICLYIDRLENIKGDEAVKIKHLGRDDWPEMVAVTHAAWMLPEMLDFVEAGRIDKAFRWLGFVQGILWQNGFYSIEELANHNRPKEEEDD